MTGVRTRAAVAIAATIASVVVPLGASVTGVASGLLAGAAAATTPKRCPAASPGVHRFAPGKGKTVALTFDDGPGPDAARIMQILTAAHVTATFFNIGLHEAANRAVVSAEHRAGFALGDHTWDHTTLTTLSRVGQASELDRERRTQASATGAYPCLLRPPGGSFDSTTLSVAAQRRLTVWNWSVDTEDWKAHGSVAPYWVDRIRGRAEAGGQLAHPVVLMHDQVGGNPATVAALPAVIAYYKSHHYRFVDLLGSSSPPAAVHLASSHSGGPTTLQDATGAVTAVAQPRQQRHPGGWVVAGWATLPGAAALSVPGLPPGA